MLAKDRQTTLERWTTPGKGAATEPSFSPVERQASLRTYAKRPNRPLRLAPESPAPPPAASAAEDSPKKLRQLHLDLGQSGFGAAPCLECGMIYARGDAADTKLHRRFHDQAIKKASSSSTPSSSVEPAVVVLRGHVAAPGDAVLAVSCPIAACAEPRPAADDAVLSVGELSSRDCWRAVAQLGRAFGPPAAAKLEAELGQEKNRRHLFLYVNEAQQLVGGCVGERSAARVRAKYLWTHAEFRRRGHATSLLDALRNYLRTDNDDDDDDDDDEFELVAPSQEDSGGALFEQAYRASRRRTTVDDAQQPSLKKARSHPGER